jgi:tetratricopeptide (TPR) repeat protein
MGRSKQALSLYMQALRPNPELRTVYYHVGIAYMDLKAYEKALHWLSRAWRLYSRESHERKAWVLEALGESLYELGKFRQAQDVLKKRRKYISAPKDVARNNGNLSNCWIAEAMRLSGIGRNVRAARAAELALHYNPANRCAKRFLMREQRRIVRSSMR